MNADNLDMRKIMEQTAELRRIAGTYKHGGISPVLANAADTIESLAKMLVEEMNAD